MVINSVGSVPEVIYVVIRLLVLAVFKTSVVPLYWLIGCPTSWIVTVPNIDQYCLTPYTYVYIYIYTFTRLYTFVYKYKYVCVYIPFNIDIRST